MLWPREWSWHLPELPEPLQVVSVQKVLGEASALRRQEAEPRALFMECQLKSAQWIPWEPQDRNHQREPGD